MRLLIMLLFTLPFNAQILNYEMIKREILSDVLRIETIKDGKVFIVSKIDSSKVEYLLKPLLEKPYVSNFNSNGESFMLTNSDIKYLAQKMREQYDAEWKEEDFNNREIIKQSEILQYLKRDNKNQVVIISNPIFIKNDDTVFLYFANLCCGEINYPNLALYKKINGIWKKWFQINDNSN
ncbi:hypothetical protein [Flavobacterium sp. HJJ]|uniref:hypothetical protein n=1 Tax=Flavobacterium sp. HJJ TaxID=2783792 RepID=UPI00188D1F7B|nr:hypothetical protein [Flavobacterium sp. HJJ]MBF4472009.1 hypothetical protein [Flavobacterium sp. HJJ]